MEQILTRPVVPRHMGGEQYEGLLRFLGVLPPISVRIPDTRESGREFRRGRAKKRKRRGRR